MKCLCSLCFTLLTDDFLLQDSFLVSVSASSDSDTALSYFNRPDDALYNLFEEGTYLEPYLLKTVLFYCDNK